MCFGTKSDYVVTLLSFSSIAEAHIMHYDTLPRTSMMMLHSQRKYDLEVSASLTILTALNHVRVTADLASNLLHAALQTITHGRLSAGTSTDTSVLILAVVVVVAVPAIASAGTGTSALGALPVAVLAACTGARTTVVTATTSTVTVVGGCGVALVAAGRERIALTGVVLVGRTTLEALLVLAGLPALAALTTLVTLVLVKVLLALAAKVLLAAEALLLRLPVALACLALEIVRVAARTCRVELSASSTNRMDKAVHTTRSLVVVEVVGIVRHDED